MITEKESYIINYLKKWKNYGIYVKYKGFINAQFTIHKLNYKSKESILTLFDKIGENYTEINISNIYNTEENKNILKLQMDNELIIELEI